MYFKNDWEQAKKRLTAFWNGEIVDRCCVGVIAPRKTSKVPSFPELQHGAWLGGLERFDDNDHESIRKWWTDPEENYKRMMLWMENTYFGGEAAPVTYINWGAMAQAAFYGSEPIFSKTTVWYPEVIKDWDDWKWEFDETNNVYWKQTLDITRYFMEQNGGRYFVGTAELGASADLLSLMRGACPLCIDFYERPEKIKEAVSVLGNDRVRLHKKLYDMTLPANDNGGVMAWMNLWAPGRYDITFLRSFVDPLTRDVQGVLCPGHQKHAERFGLQHVSSGRAGCDAEPSGHASGNR